MAQDARGEGQGAAFPTGAKAEGTTERKAPCGPAPFLSARTLKSKAATWIGMAVMFAWVNLLLCFEGVLRDDEAMQGGLVHDPLFLCATVAASLMLLGTAAAYRLHRPRRVLQPNLFAHRTPLLAVCGVGAACAAAAVLLTAFAPTAPSAWSSLVGVGVGACVGWCALAWGDHCSRLDLRAALLLVSTAACAQWLPFILLAVLSATAQALLMAALPLASGALLLRSERREGDGARPDGASTGSAAARPDARRRADAARSPMLVRLALAMGTFSCVVQFVWCYFIKMLPGHLDVSLFPGVFAVVTVVCALVVGLCAGAMRAGGTYRLELYYRATFVFCLCGVAATAVAAGDLSMGELFASYTLVYVGSSLVGPTMWMLALGFAYMRRDDARKVLGAVLAGQYLGLFAGFAAVELLASSALAKQGQQIMPVVAFVLVAALAVAYTALFPERDLLSLSPLLFGMSHESVARRCEALARERGLTPREAEILALLARGRDVGYVCEELCIARNTVNAHRKSIYAKLGVHSQQELLSAVEEAQA